MDCHRKDRSTVPSLVVAALLCSLTCLPSISASLSPNPSATPGFHDHSGTIKRNNTQFSSTTPRPGPGYFVPPQVVKINHQDAAPAFSVQQQGSDQNSITTRNNNHKISSGGDNLKESSQQSEVIEQLPKPEAHRSSSSSGGEYKTAYGLPGYNGPEDFTPRRGTTAADYSATGAGFVPSDPFQNKQPRYTAPSFESLERYGTFKPSASEFVPTTFHSSDDQFGSRRYHHRQNQQQDNRRPYDSQSGSSPDYNSAYTRAASESSSSIPGGSQSQSQQQQDNFPPPQSRRKPFSDPDIQSSSSNHHQGPYDQSFPQSKHYLSTEVIRDHTSSDMFADGQASQSMEQAVSATNDNELAQLAATMSEFSSSPTSTPDFGMSGSDSLGLTDTSGFGSLGSSSMLASHPFAGSMPSPNSVPGVPAGAIVGAPGSAPPPGMKLAGYVTMAGPAPNAGMGMAGMGSMMNPMMAASMMRNPMMSGSMPMRYPMMPPGSLGPLGGLGPMGGMGPMGMGGPGMMTPPGMGGMGNMGNMGNMGGMGGLSPAALSQMFGPSFAQQAAQVLGQSGVKTAAASSTSTGTGTTTSANNSQGSQTSASTPSRSRFLSRLNPLNLFRRLRSRAQASKVSSSEDKGIESMMASESNPVPVKKGFSFLKRSDNSNFIATNSSQDRIAAENFPLPVPNLFYRNSFVQPLFRFETPSASTFQFPRRRGRRIQEGPRFFDTLSESSSGGGSSKNTAMMGSGNFEVIRGGLLPTGDKQQDEKTPEASIVDEEQQFFSAGRPAVLGFQGFNHFAGAPIYNSLSSDSKPVHQSPDSPPTPPSASPVAGNSSTNNAIIQTLSSVASLIPLVGQ